MTSQKGSENAIIDQIKISVSPTSSPENIHVYTHTHTVLPQASFYPVGLFHYGDLYNDLRSPREWLEFFSDSYVVHMYNSSKNTERPILRPKYFGKNWPAYLYLAANFCPVSFYSEKKF
jgi:hypothetical protein